MISDAPDAALLDIKVIPRAGKTAFAGTRDNLLLIRLAAAPVEGAANAALIGLLADLLGVPKRQISIVGGATGRIKRVKVMGASAAFVRTRLDIPT